VKFFTISCVTTLAIENTAQEFAISYLNKSIQLILGEQTIQVGGISHIMKQAQFDKLKESEIAG
jgi:hypothetical protein